MAAGPSADYRRPPGAGARGESAAGEPGSAAPAGKPRFAAPAGKHRSAVPAGEPARRRFRPWRALRIASGFLLLALGVIGLFLPILQGVLMILAGLAVLGKDLPWSRALTDRLAAFVKRRASGERKPGKAATRPEAS